MIRRAEIKDIDSLNRLLYQVQTLHAEKRPDIFKLGAKKYTSQELARIIADDMTPIFVYEEEGVVMGYAFCIYQITEENDQLYERKALYIDDLCVDKPYRRKHIGQKLYEYVLETARENGCDSVTLNVWRVNPSAERFYQKMGMQPLKTTMETILD
ncbi:GNAT family N-acetyltransferase [Ruminococcus sp.]|uniref:GNAT family N-acetyltransferase n=1 Tax=Ruminococcus sp. TaxID=41978 RepID=UPI002873294B|nr:GNAT family N-acetyltransferase [Ruminococcus sp.]